MDDSYSYTVRDVLNKLGTNTAGGLSSEEAANRRKRYGMNEMKPGERTSWFLLVLKQFDDLLVKILLGAAVVSFFLGIMEKDGSLIEALIEPSVIMMILILNAIVGVWQESSAEKSIEALKKYESPSAVVLRGGKKKVIRGAELVPGDIIFLETGAKVAADARIVEIRTICLRMNQSLLTGETLAVQKQMEPIKVTEHLVNQDKINIAFAGTTVTQGCGLAVVVLTGEGTSMGKIQKSLIDSEEVKTPLGEKLDEFAELLSKVITVICIIVWLINIGHFSDPEYGSIFNGAIYYFKIAIALAVAAIPEGLPAVVTTCLALGTYRMAKKNAIVRSLPSVETLGCTSVICSDKTGTLTTNKMLVTDVMVLDKAGKRSHLKVQGKGFEPSGGLLYANGDRIYDPAVQDTSLNVLAKIATLCNEAQLQFSKMKWSIIGGATEGALKVLAEKIGAPIVGFLKDETSGIARPTGNKVETFWKERWERVHLLEFSRDRKCMSVIVSETSCKKQQLLCKGAPENIISNCTNVLVGGVVRSFNTSARAEAMNSVEQLQQEGLRCIAFAYKDFAKVPKLEAGGGNPTDHFIELEKELVFVGVAGMHDPPRAEVRKSILTCNRAGVRVIVITGDNKETAESICRSIGVFQQGQDLKNKSFQGVEFMQMSEHEQQMAVRTASLFSRVEPAHKQTLVDMLQKQGEVVAMTGDGVNDAPALKQADIGVSMGSGTDVAKEASDMVLQDDNFSTIVAAVEEGRAIYANTKQFIRYLISSNIGEVATIFFIAALGLPEALIPVQLLWVNLVTDGLPATALGFNKPDKDIMKQLPRARTEKIINGWMFFRYFFIGMYVGIGTVVGFIWWWMYYAQGPLLSFQQVTSHHLCGGSGELASKIFPSEFDCMVFKDHHASTVALSILVTIEMFNTFNALSENQSLLVQTPLTNIWVMLAVALSMVLHVVILYNDFFIKIFSTASLNSTEWFAVIAISFPVIVLDEGLKFISRRMVVSSITKRRRLTKASNLNQFRRLNFMDYHSPSQTILRFLAYPRLLFLRFTNGFGKRRRTASDDDDVEQGESATLLTKYPQRH